MVAKLRSWWRKIKHYPMVAIVVFVGSALGIALIVVIVLGYWLNWHWTGLVPETSEPKQHAKSLWDWLNLFGVLAIPAVVALGAAWYTAQQGKVSTRENKDNQREAALQDYIDKISELLLKEHLGELTADGKLKPEYYQVRKIARVRTLTILPRLDSVRKGSVLQFLHDSGLIAIDLMAKEDKNIIDLSGADLSRADLKEALLSAADLREANLREANLREALLLGVNLSEADLSGANLSEVFMSGANLSRANLSRANLSRAVLDKADLSNAILSDANLGKADLKEASMRRANLSGANLSGAKLSGANLIYADLSEANLKDATSITTEQLDKANSLQGATMPDGSKHP